MIEEFIISDLLAKIADANKTLDYLKKISRLKNSPLQKDIQKLIKKVDVEKNKYVKKYDQIYKDICEEADFFSQLEE
mgnify:CR=1 FL=1